MINKLHLKPRTRKDLYTLLMVAAAFILVEILILTGNISSSVRGWLVPICYNIILAVSLNLVVGFLGELSLGHAGFMCVGAFASAMFSVAARDTITSAWVRFPIALLIGGVVAAIFGILIGIPVLRLKGDYLAIVTLAFGEIIKNLINIFYVGKDAAGIHISTSNTAALNLDPGGIILLKGPMGVVKTPNDSTFAVGFVLVMLVLIVSMRLVNSRTGRAITAIRDNAIAAESVGINIPKYKLIVFSVSAFFAGIGGVLYSHNIAQLSATTNNFGYNMSIMILVFVVLGGMANIRGSIIAATILTILPEALRGFSSYRMLVYAIVLIILMITNNNETLVRYREIGLKKIYAFISKAKTPSKEEDK